MPTKVTDDMTVSIPTLTNSLSAVTKSLSAVNTQVFGAGAILQAAYTETQELVDIYSQELAPITQLQITITPRRANSKFLLQSMLNTSGEYVASYGFMQFINSAWTSIGGATTPNANTSNAAIATTYYGFGAGTQVYMTNNYITHLHAPSYTLGQSLVYTAGICSSWSGTIYLHRLNTRSPHGAGGIYGNDMGSKSSLTIFEIG